MRSRSLLAATFALVGCGAPPPASTPPDTRPRQLPIYFLYVNHVEVESVVPMGCTSCTSTPELYARTRDALDQEIGWAEAAGGAISFHMSGAYAEQAVAAGDAARWGTLLAAGHTLGLHFHTFLRGAGAFQWIRELMPAPTQIAQAWQDHYDFVAQLAAPEEIWIGESHYGCSTCWESLGFRIRSTEAMAALPAGQHIVWRVERDSNGVIAYPHLTQIGVAEWHGPATGRVFFDLRLPQLQKEMLMLYLEWLERERAGSARQVWAFGFANHGGAATTTHGADIQAMFAWVEEQFLSRTSPRGNPMGAFVSDHDLAAIYEAWEPGAEPLPAHASTVTDSFPYLAAALADAGLVEDLTASIGVGGVRLFAFLRVPPDGSTATYPNVLLLARETDGETNVDLAPILAARGVDLATVRRIDVVTGSTGALGSATVALGAMPIVLEAP